MHFILILRVVGWLSIGDDSWLWSITSKANAQKFTESRNPCHLLVTYHIRCFSTVMLWSCWRSCSLSWPCPWHWLRPSPFPFIEHETPSRARISGKIAYAFFDVQFVWGNFMFQFMICRGSPRPSTDLCRQHKKFLNWHHLIGWKICFMFYVPIRMSPVQVNGNGKVRMKKGSVTDTVNIRNIHPYRG